jgi:hypothetical protein
MCAGPALRRRAGAGSRCFTACAPGSAVGGVEGPAPANTVHFNNAPAKMLGIALSRPAPPRPAPVEGRGPPEAARAASWQARIRFAAPVQGERRRAGGAGPSARRGCVRGDSAGPARARRRAGARGRAASAWLRGTGSRRRSPRRWAALGGAEQRRRGTQLLYTRSRRCSCATCRVRSATAKCLCRHARPHAARSQRSACAGTRAPTLRVRRRHDTGAAGAHAAAGRAGAGADSVGESDGLQAAVGLAAAAVTPPTHSSSRFDALPRKRVDLLLSQEAGSDASPHRAPARRLTRRLGAVTRWRWSLSY